MGKFQENIADAVRVSVLDDVIRANRASNGEIFWVVEDSDTDFNLLTQRYGNTNVFTTVKEAYDACTTNRNDIIFISANTGHTLTAMLDVSKSRVHFVGLDAGAKRRYGQRSRISIGVTTAVTDLAAVQVTGVGCSFRGIKFSSSNTLTEGLYTFIDAGEYTYIENCEFYLSAQLSVTTAGEFVANGDSSHYKDCLFGSLVNVKVGDIIRPNIVVTRDIVSGKVARDVTFEGCFFWMKSAGTTSAHVHIIGATAVERTMIFKDCLFQNAKLSTGTPAVAISGTATLTEGQVVVMGSSVTVNSTKLATLTGVINGVLTYTAAGGIGIQST